MSSKSFARKTPPSAISVSVLSRNVAKVVRLGMELLGIEMPERM